MPFSTVGRNRCSRGGSAVSASSTVCCTSGLAITVVVTRSVIRASTCGRSTGLLDVADEDLRVHHVAPGPQGRAGEQQGDRADQDQQADCEVGAWSSLHGGQGPRSPRRQAVQLARGPSGLITPAG